MGSKLLTNGYVVTVDGERAVYPNGFVHVEGERISAVGPMSDLGSRTADETIDLHGMLAMRPMHATRITRITLLQV